MNATVRPKLARIFLRVAGNLGGGQPRTQIDSTITIAYSLVTTTDIAMGQRNLRGWERHHETLPRCSSTGARGDSKPLDKLIPVVYTELRRQPARHLRRERPGHTFQTTDLIHEAYLRLVDQKNALLQRSDHWGDGHSARGVADDCERRLEHGQGVAAP